VEPQDQPGNCPECGMKLLEMQTKQTSRRLGGLNADSADLRQTGQKSTSAKSVFHSASSAFFKKILALFNLDFNYNFFNILSV
jgi:hypothetical protein